MNDKGSIKIHLNDLLEKSELRKTNSAKKRKSNVHN